MVTLFKPGIHQTHETKQYREEDVIWTSLFLMNRPGKGYLSSNCLETRSQIGRGEVQTRSAQKNKAKLTFMLETKGQDFLRMYLDIGLVGGNIVLPVHSTVLVEVQKAERETPGLGGAILALLFQYSLLYCSP